MAILVKDLAAICNRYDSQRPKTATRHYVNATAASTHSPSSSIKLLKSNVSESSIPAKLSAPKLASSLSAVF